MKTNGKLRIVVTVCVLMACPSAVATAKVIYVDDDAPVRTMARLGSMPSSICRTRWP